jgi:hypothetical protein
MPADKVYCNWFYFHVWVICRHCTDKFFSFAYVVAGTGVIPGALWMLMEAGALNRHYIHYVQNIWMNWWPVGKYPTCFIQLENMYPKMQSKICLDCGLVGYDIVQSLRLVSTSQMNVLPPSLGQMGDECSSKTLVPSLHHVITLHCREASDLLQDRVQ